MNEREYTKDYCLLSEMQKPLPGPVGSSRTGPYVCPIVSPLPLCLWCCCLPGFPFSLTPLNPCPLHGSYICHSLCLESFSPGSLLGWLFIILPVSAHVSASQKRSLTFQSKGTSSQHPVSVIVLTTLPDGQANFLVYLFIFISWSRKSRQELHVL